MGAIPSVLILLVLLIEHISPSFPQATSEIAHTPRCNPLDVVTRSISAFATSMITVREATVLTVLNVLTSSNMSISCSVFVAFHTKLSVPRSCVLKICG